GGDQLGDDEIGPRPAERDAQRVDHPWHGRRDENARHHRAAVGAQRVGDIQQVVRYRPRDVGDEDELLEEGAEEDDRDLLPDVDADPQDEQRDERADRDVAHEIGDRLDRRLDDLEAAHEDAERHREDRREDEAGHDLGEADPGIDDQRAVLITADRRLDHLDRRRQEVRAHQLAIGEHAPENEDGDPDERAYRQVNASRDLLLRRGRGLEKGAHQPTTESVDRRLRTRAINRSRTYS